MPLQDAPLQNRADPTGRLFANTSRGLFTGNRGVIHDPDTRELSGRGWTTKAWIICDCGFQGRKREVFGRNTKVGKTLTSGAGWTNIFFLDEVTALAAGHRPCFECRRDKAREFADCFARAFGLAGVKAADIDAKLHSQRVLSAPDAVRDRIDVSDAPDGVVFEDNGAFFVSRRQRHLRWDFEGYSSCADTRSPVLRTTPPPLREGWDGSQAGRPSPTPETGGGVARALARDGEGEKQTQHLFRLITPPATVAVLAAGYQPIWHSSAA